MAKFKTRRHQSPPITKVTTDYYLIFLIGLKFVLLLVPVRLLLKLFLIAASVWLLLGIGIYTTSALSYQKNYVERMKLRNAVLAQDHIWQSILRSHPTAKTVLEGAIQSALILGENQRAQEYQTLLKRLDP